MGSPTRKTIKRLFALSRNQCAFPGCSSLLTDLSSDRTIGEICHIKAQRPNAPRYDPNQGDSDRHAFENLILLCPNHHNLIDSDVDFYTVERLKQIKSEHERGKLRNPEVSDDLLNRLINYNDDLTRIENEKQTQRYNHDLDVFRRSDMILNETNLRNALTSLFDQHLYNDRFRIAVTNYCDFCSESQNQYIDKILKQSSIYLVEVLEQLINFFDINFFMISTSQSVDIWYRLHPHLCMDRNFLVSEEEALKYDGYVAQLNDTGDDVKRGYEIYRRSVKEVLIV